MTSNENHAYKEKKYMGDLAVEP